MTRLAKIIFVLLFLGVVALWAYFPKLIELKIPEGSSQIWAQRGTFGDSYGVLTSLFSALAFCGVAVTLYLQSKQMSQLKEQEDDTANAQALQTRLMAVTALLNTYNTQANLLQEKRDRLREQIGFPAVLEHEEYRYAINKSGPIVKKRNEILEELEILLKTGLPAKNRDVTEAQSAATEAKFFI